MANHLPNALYLAAHYPVKEVGLFFNNKLLHGNHTVKAHADEFDVFASPNLPPSLEAGIPIRIRYLTPSPACAESVPLRGPYRF
ncbi:MAG: L-asparaginase 1 [Sodalis sp.]|nr:MAG: L-asparaginase 1 [Sodalis sp.]